LLNTPYQLKRKYSILLVLLVLALCVNAQFKAYQPFPVEGAWWSETTWCEALCNGIFTGESRDFDYYISGDTMLNGKAYHKLNVAGGGEWYACAPTFTAQHYDSLIGCFREDSKRIYYCDFKRKIYDTLLYDFNLKVGDVLPDTYINHKEQYYRVYAIDSVLIGISYRREYIISHDSINAFAKLIEGIGSNGGLLEPISMPFESGGRLNCFVQNGKTVYPRLNDSCQLYNSSPAPQNLKVFAAPHNIVTITYQLPKGQNKGLLKLYNIGGNMINMKEIEANKSPVIDDMPNLLNGVYYYTLWVNNKIIATYKFVVVQ
jgi:hypothetical protein